MIYFAQENRIGTRIQSPNLEMEPESGIQNISENQIMIKVWIAKRKTHKINGLCHMKTGRLCDFHCFFFLKALPPYFP